MGILLTLIAGLVLWIVLWAIGTKSFDAFLITLVMLIVASAVHFVVRYLPGNREQDRQPAAERFRRTRREASCRLNYRRA